MPKKEDSGQMISETGNWNVADSYVKLKIMKPLALCDYYQDIASFGYESIIEELVDFESPPNDYIRFTGLRRLISELIKLIDNSKFALKKGKTRKTALTYKKYLKQMQKALPKLISVTRDASRGTSGVSIANYAGFSEFLDAVTTIKSKLNEPLNENHLIFVDKEEFDPIAFKDRIKRRMTHKG